MINAVVSSALAGLRRVSLISSVLSFSLVVWGAVVRVNGAGMTCPDWPRCQGAWLPALDNATVFEWSHRLGAIVVTTIILATFAMAWRCRAERPDALRAAWFSVSLIAAQIVAGWLTIKYQNNPPSVALHLVIGFSTFVSLLLVTAIAYAPAAPPASATGEIDRARDLRFARLAFASSAVAFCAVFAAGYMSAANDGIACVGFPLCGGLGGALTLDQQIHMGHRLAAYATIVAVLVTAIAAFAWQRGRREIVAVTWVALGLAALQGVLGVLAVLTRLDPVVRVWHEANGALVAGSLALLTYYAYARLPRTV